MRRVVITGIGIISSIGNNAAEVEASLRAGRSGIVFAPEYAEHGFRSQVHGMPQINLADHIDKRDMRFMGPGAAYNFLAMQQAIADSGLTESEVSNDRSGLIMGSGGPSTSNFFQAFDAVINKGAPKGPFMVTRCMSSTNSACLATPFKIKKRQNRNKRRRWKRGHSAFAKNALNGDLKGPGVLLGGGSGTMVINYNPSFQISYRRRKFRSYERRRPRRKNWTLY